MPFDQKERKLSKLQVAEIELDATIQMWFEEYDPFAINLIVSSSQTIIATLLKKEKKNQNFLNHFMKRNIINHGIIWYQNQ